MLTFYKLAGPMTLRIAVIADLHERDGSKVLYHLRSLHPDLICIPGDLFDGNNRGIPTVDISRILPFLRHLSSLAPVFLSLGNHEWVLHPEDLEALADPVTVLDNSFVIRDGIAVGGLTSGRIVDFRAFCQAVSDPLWARKHYRESKRPPNPAPDSSWLPDFDRAGQYRILLCHHPEYFAIQEPFLQDRKIDLVLSGHAHGGQIRLFGRGLYAPNQGILPRYTSGIHHGSYGSLIISRGLANTACWIPRLFNPRELVIIDIHP